MKKIICIVLILCCTLGLPGCLIIDKFKNSSDIDKNSLDEYILHIKRYGFGFSSGGIDRPENIIPSVSFFDDYEYIEGCFHYHQDDSLNYYFSTHRWFETAFICLRYDEKTYFEAKCDMMEKIEPYNNKIYRYNDYLFYENSNHIKLNHEKSLLPEDFSMACYNDEKFTLIFLAMWVNAFAGASTLDEKYLYDIENNWESFVDEYFGEYYDFSK